MLNEKVLKTREYCRTYYYKNLQKCQKKARERYHKKKIEWMLKEQPIPKLDLVHIEMKKTIFIFD